ncbi:hypothetical protein H0H92_003914 [Tricholoma furcatifolium]|nr:hypothetical protein H0H92_003914 [Tricholoma furcatifolium]
MAHNREWDQGKDAWQESSWGDSRANVRPREDDHYGEGKRRKFNHGGFQNYDANQAYDNGSHDRHHPQGAEQFQDYGYKKRLVPSEPSAHVIFLGLDPDFTEADLRAYLSTNGSSKGFGFAQFTTIEHARSFVDPLFPYIHVPPPASHGASATAAYYKSLETGNPVGGRRVKIDYSQSALPHDKNRSNRGNMNDGTRDIGNSQAPVLLFRGLDPLSGPQAIHQAMLYSSGPTMQGAKGMRRIILIKDKVTMASFGFAFVEFVDVASASAVLAATMSPAIHPAGFRISDRPVAASFAHPYSFQPVTEFLQRDDACLKSSMSLGGVEDTWVRYWDENSTVAVLEFKVEEPTPAVQVAEKKKEKKKKTEVEVRPAPVAPSALPVSDKPVTLNFSKGPIKTAAGEERHASIILKPLALGFSIDDGGAVAAAKKVPPLIASKKATPHPSSSHVAPLPAEVEFEFSDVTALTCLLCARQFKSLDQLKRHNKESDLHKARNFNAVYSQAFFGLTLSFKNSKDANLREVARQKVAARKAETEQPKYRDRASERRVLFNQPEVPIPEKDTSKIKQKKVEGPPSPPTPPPVPVNPGQDASNVGNKLLKMMGWTEGSGLGTSGEGRVEPMFVSHILSSTMLALTIMTLVKLPSMLKVLAWGPVKAKKSVNIPMDILATSKWHRTRHASAMEIKSLDFISVYM